MRKNRVVWTEDQVAALIEACYELRQQDPEPSLLQIIKLTQEIIFKPEERRYIATAAHVAEIIKGVKERYGIVKQPERYVDKYKELEERIERLERLLKATPRMKIGLAGFKNNQFNEIEKGIEGRANLIFIDRDQARASLPSSANYIIVANDFISHRFINQLESRFSKDRIIGISGTIDSARKKILELTK